jgi:Uma2 family endonuclease
MKVDHIIPRYTYKDYASWQGDWELIDGYPYAMSPSPKMKHQLAGKRLMFLLENELLKKTSCQCTTVYELDWIINDDTIVRPDVMIICGPIEDDFLRYPPTLLVEILSDSTRLKDRNTKFTLYEQQGVKYYLLADPTKNTLEIFELKDNRYQSNDSLKVFDLHGKCQIEVALDSIFNV